MNAAGRSTGDAYGHALISIAASDERIVALEGGDAAWSSPFSESYPSPRTCSSGSGRTEAQTPACPR